MRIFFNHQEAIQTTLKLISLKYKHLYRFCDLGCGAGEKTIKFIEPGRTVTGIDSKNYGTSYYQRFKFIHGDMFNNKLPAKSFDMILSYDVIEHINNPDDLLKEIHRLLKDNGICILSTPNKYRLMNIVPLLFGVRKYPYCIDEQYKDDYPNYWHLTEYSDQELTKIVLKNKFTLLKHRKIFYGVPQYQGFKSLFGLPAFHNHILELKKITHK